MDAVDSYVPQPEARDRQAVPDADRRRVLDLGPRHRRHRPGREGPVKVGEEVEIVGFKDTTKTVVTGVEMFRKILDEGQAGDNVGVLAARRRSARISSADRCWRKPGSITPHTNFEASAYILTKDEGGRHTPFFSGYRPQFYFRTTDVTGVLSLPEGTEMVMPGDNIKIQGELITPVAMDEGLRFAIREGGRTVGAGVVAKILK